MSWTLSGEYIQHVSAFPQPRLAAWWPCSLLCFWVCLSASTFCSCSFSLLVIPASRQSPALSDPVGNAATSYALSLLLLPVPGCLWTCVLVPSYLRDCAEGRASLAGATSPICVQSSGQAELEPAEGYECVPSVGLPFLLQLQHLTVFANGDSELQGMRNSRVKGLCPSMSHPSRKGAPGQHTQLAPEGDGYSRMPRPS